MKYIVNRNIKHGGKIIREGTEMELEDIKGIEKFVTPVPEPGITVASVFEVISESVPSPIIPDPEFIITPAQAEVIPEQKNKKKGGDK